MFVFSIIIFCKCKLKVSDMCEYENKLGTLILEYEEIGHVHTKSYHYKTQTYMVLHTSYLLFNLLYSCGRSAISIS